MARLTKGDAAVSPNTLRARTGLNLEDWKAIVRNAGLTKSGQIVELLQTKYSVPEAHAKLIAAASVSKAPPCEDAYLDDLYVGPRASLRPLHEALAAKIMRLGRDVTIVPTKMNVSFKRRKRFASVGPANASELMVGLNLEGVTPAGRLERTTSYTALFSHRVRVGSLKEVDSELMGWLRQAYDRA